MVMTDTDKTPKSTLLTSSTLSDTSLGDELLATCTCYVAHCVQQATLELPCKGLQDYRTTLVYSLATFEASFVTLVAFLATFKASLVTLEASLVTPW